MGDWSHHYKQIIKNHGDKEWKLHPWDYFPNFRQPSSRKSSVIITWERGLAAFLLSEIPGSSFLRFICFVIVMVLLSPMSLSPRRSISIQRNCYAMVLCLITHAKIELRKLLTFYNNKFTWLQIFKTYSNIVGCNSHVVWGYKPQTKMVSVC